MMLMTTSSSGPSTTLGPRVLATRLSDSDALRVKTIWLPWGLPFSSTAPMKRAILLRASSIADVASTERRYRPRSGFAFMVV